ncbi:hypothetical protein QZM82_13305 [Burkholderia cepacia]|uniref:hypothetical protein n=1 Tax=Burkholderia cepacia TaxID=292 RepID=UPI0026564A7D|nr:hypothetical protein [Burkholderia cepacia]MDN7897168.1 hypothetical protein [Burkholderia cepacia]
MSDRELLELAAKAAGIDARRLPHAWPNRFDDDQWNPLIDDGDALRLAVKLNIRIAPVANGRDVCAAFYTDHPFEASVETHGTDKQASVRRAIVRAAAEIAKAREA